MCLLIFTFLKNFIYHIDNTDSMDKVKVQLDKDIVTSLIRLKEVGDTYSDVVRRLLKIASGKQ